MRSRLAFCLVAAAAGCVAIAHPQEDLRTAGEAALKNRQYAEAIKLLTAALGSAQQGQDEILYALATAEQHDGKHDAALATLDRLLKDFPQSPLSMKALYKKGDLLAAKKEFQIAAATYDGQVAALTAPARRKKLAMVYVEAGREFLTPKDPKDPTFVANTVAAHKLLTKSLELESLGPDEEGVRVDIITCELKGQMGRPELLKSCDTLIEKFPSAARMDEVLFAKATALRDVGRVGEAEKTWSKLATNHAASKLAPEGLWLAAHMHANESGVEELRRALPLLRRIAKDFATSEWAPKAEFQIGTLFAQDEDLHEEARREFLAFVEKRPKDEQAPEALLRVAWLHREDGNDAQAITTLEDFLKRFPDSPRWPEVRQTIADIRWARIDRVSVRKDWNGVRSAVQEFVDAHAADSRAPNALFRVADTYREEKKYREAVDAWMKVAVRFPSHDEGHHARFAAASLLASELDEFETALKELPKVGGAWSSEAQQFLQRLQAKSIAVASERVFHSDEAPTVKLTARNVESVTFKLWMLDLKDYFEKKASMGGLQALEVSVIAPDVEWEHAVKDFKRFKEMKIDVALPKKEPGAYVVTASAGLQEATTIVLVSDLAMIARAGRKGATVLVQNQRTGEAVPGATIHTAADGKHLKAWTKETTAGRLSFLAESSGHLAFRDLDVSALPAVAERTPRAVIFTDRRTYAAEDSVGVRIIVRDAMDDAFVVPKEKKYRLAAVSAQGVPFFEETLALSKHGTAGAQFQLLRGLSGGVRLDLYEVAKPAEKLVAQASVRIGLGATRSVGFDFLYDDKTYFVGDDIDVTVVLRDPWNRPMPHRKVRVKTSADAEWRDAMTAVDGTFAVSIRETAQFYRIGSVAIDVQTEGAVDQQVIPLKPRGTFLAFEEASRGGEPVLVGDTKELFVVAKDGADQPIAATYDWTVVRANEAGERSVVASGKLTTAADGKGKFAFLAKEAGIHTTRVMTRDAEGLPVRAQTAVAVFDEKNERKLRLRSTTDTFESSKAMEFTVVSRLEKGLAYITVEGEKIEQVVPVMLEKGANVIHLGPPPATTRDFTVAVMMMQSNAFHADVRDFFVKAPEVKIDVPKEVRPGDEAVVKVSAKPGSEVILVAAENVLTGCDVTTFNPARPGAHFKVDSSVATSFTWATQELDPRLIEALARLDQLNKEEAAPVMLEKDFAKLRDADKPAREPMPPPATGQIGGGGRQGGRFGGKRVVVELRAEPAPVAFLTSEADAAGVATFRFRVPQGWGEYSVVAWAVDSGNAIATSRAELKVRAPVTVVFRGPESALLGEKTSAVALLTNHTTQAQEVTLSLSSDVKVTVPARSTLEQVFEWTAAPPFALSFALDGVKQEHRVVRRPVSPVSYVESGGAFSAATQLKPGGEGKFPRTVRYAVGPTALFESLAEGRDEFNPAGDAAARLIALLARHRYAKSDATKRAVMEFAMVRAAGLIDTMQGTHWPVLTYLAAAEAKAAEFDITADANMLKHLFVQAPHDDGKALILFALARGGEAQFGYVHRLWRSADTLSPRALACVALALKALGKPDEAKAALERLAKLVKDGHWEAADVPVADSSNTHFVATALAAFAFAEIDPASPHLVSARSWLLGRTPMSAFERAVLALAMQSTPDKSEVKELKIDGKTVSGFGEIDVDVASPKIEPTGAGTYYAVLRLETVGPPPANMTIKRTAEWPLQVLHGVTVARAPVTLKEPVENPSMEKVAAGQAFDIAVELTMKGPTTQVQVIELDSETGWRVEAGRRRVLIPPQTEAERKIVHRLLVYADLPGGSVLPVGSEFRAGYQMTHAERLSAGRIHFEKKQWKEAKEMLAPLFEKGTLQDWAAVEAARMLAYAGVELGDHAMVVRYFEILKEKSPTEVVPFDKVRAVGRAYAATGEHERAMQVYQGTCDAYFLQEAFVVGALGELGRTRQAAEQMKALLLDHPDSQMNREMVFGFGQQLYSKGRVHHDPVEKDPKALTRSELLAEAAAALERYAAWFPQGTEGEQVALALGSTYLEAAKYADAERVGVSATLRWPKSRFLDAYDYTTAVAQFAQRRFEQSLAMCDRLETFDYGKNANPGPAVMRERALLIKAQIFHAKGELDKALENYKKVRETSLDADRSIAFLEREAIAVPEITLAPLAKGAEVELEYAGVAEAHVRAYKVDLTVLALRRKGLADAATIEVAGFKPVFEHTVKLDHPNARRRERQKLALELKEPGAYLVGVKAGDFFASGLVLRSNLGMTVQEEAAGTVRVNIADSATGAFVEGVRVTIFGTGDQKIASDKTDLRGIWESHGVCGLAVVVAEKDGHVAMYRGATALAPEPQARRRLAAQAEAQTTDALDERVQRANEDYGQRWEGNIRKQQLGVEVERTKK